MNPGEVVLISLPQSTGGAPKLRPAVVLSQLPGPFQNRLICGVSTQVHNLVIDWDELVRLPEQSDASTLRDSIIY